VVYDMNGREASDTEPILAAVGDVEQYIFCSSAGVYLKSDQMPHMETDATDPNSRHKVERQLQNPGHRTGNDAWLLCAHTTVPEQSDVVHVRKHGFGKKHKTQGVSGPLQGKLNTEDLLQSRGLNWTSVRPVYIYGPLNYNPVEEWFFQRLAEGRPIPIPNSGQQVGAVGRTSPIHAADCCLV
jgi:hypothetical protein